MADSQSTTYFPPTETTSQHGESRPVTITATETSADNFTPNHGASIPDEEAIGKGSQPLSEWQKSNNIDPSNQIKLVKLVHMRYQHPDFPTITKFLRDFGMHIAKETPTEIWFKGYGPDQYVYSCTKGEKKFLGGTFSVESMSDLEKAVSLPSAAGPITEMKDAPGGGHIITLHDPEGFPINLIYGQTPSPQSDVPEKVIYNDETDKPRVRKFNRFTPGPAAVHKLGHYGLCVQSFHAQLQWYTSTFNLAPTDFLYVDTLGGRKDVAVFAHIDRGLDPVDHHTFFMSTNKTSHVHHASFEVHDFDTQQLGHQWLAKQNYTSVWGVGRHILGSQIFDYWWDTTGNMVEHYCDGDLVNKDTPVGWGEAGDEGLAVWGPEVPKWFLE